MRVLVTGAAGFVGLALAAELRRRKLSDLVLTDRQISGPGAMQGDLTDEGFVADLFSPGFDLIFHLASLPGARAEAEPDLGHRINLLAPMTLARTAAKARPGARFVFASSIAVYGRLTDPVTEATPCHPDLTYGAHKRMIEILLGDLTRRGDLSAISLRLPGIVARPEAETGHGSAFMSQLFHKIAAGKPYECPVPQTARCWWMSRRACVAALLHAAELTGRETVIQPPVLHLTTGAVAQAVAEVTGQRPKVEWGHDPRLTALFGAMPALEASPALRLGFQADADARTLVAHALAGDPP
jgi:nucleoside-diphosphate-sugar epimerase